MTREEAVQRWPVEKKAPLTVHSTAVLRSASSSTTSGFLPPISSWNFFIVPTQASATLRPVDTEPVKVMALTSRDFSSVSPTTEPRPMTRLKTPEGMPARTMISDRAWAEPGTRSAGLKTTVLP